MNTLDWSQRAEGFTEWPEPSARLAHALARAARSEPDVHNAAVLATVDAKGRPSARVILVKDISAQGVVFYTNYQSRKGQELEANPYAALCFHFKTLAEQVRLEGRCERISAEESDAYFATRPKGSQVSAIASQQSQPIESRDALEATFAQLSARHASGSAPRPEHWGGYRLTPDCFEFWFHRDSRLHDRDLYIRSHDGWTRSLLQP